MLKYWWYRVKFNLAPYVNWKAPVHLDIELAGKCPLRCVMCNFGTGSFTEDLQGMMPTEMAKKAILEGRALGVKSLKLNFRGEAALHKSLGNLIRLAKSVGYTEVMINTSLHGFSKPRLKDLALSGIDKIIISIDGADKTTYESIRKGGDFDKLRENFFSLMKWKKKTHVKVQMVVQCINKGQEEKLKTMFPADSYAFQKVQDRGAGEGYMADRKKCPQPFQRLIVAWDGTLFGCCSNWLNEFPLGDYKTMSLRQAWEGERMQELRKIASDPNQGFPCQKCTVGVSYK